MSSFTQRLMANKLLVSDGAWGTQMAARGLPPGEAPERWNLDKPDEVRAVAAGYVEAGSDIILTNTFGGSLYKLVKVELEKDAFEINRQGVEMSKQAAAGKALVFASIGPSGEFMQPLGTVTEEEMVATFGEQVKALVAGEPDGIVIETMTDLGEAKAALKAVKENCSLPVVACMAFDKGHKGYATMMGVRPEQAGEQLQKAGADAVGANCGSGIDDMVNVIRAMRPACDVPIWAKPNAGLPQLIDGQTVFKEAPEEMVKHLLGLVEAGASIVGGCCGTTPDHIRLFATEARNIVKAGRAYMAAVEKLQA